VAFWSVILTTSIEASGWEVPDAGRSVTAGSATLVLGCDR
jgi:hypothetical protein